MNILVTGCAGFIGYHICKKLIKKDYRVIGIDSLNDYYDVNLKKDRLKELKKKNKNDNFIFYKKNLIDKKFLDRCFKKYNFKKVLHLAAQAGVRYSLINPHSYIENNVLVFQNIIEMCRNHKIGHLIYASSSSVYGMNTKMPLSENDLADHPIQLYAATKRSNELIAHAYSSLYNLPTTGLRFFTAYGPWGRPDMALFKFVSNILNNKPIMLHNKGKHQRDFTYIDDVVSGVDLCLKRIPKKNNNISSKYLKPNQSKAPFEIFNIGQGKPISLLKFINLIEKELGMKSIKKLIKLQPGDIESTHADITDLVRKTNFSPKTNVETGIKNFINWYKQYYKVY